MDLGSIFLILAGVVLVAIFIARPFMDHKVEAAPLIEQKTTDHEEHQRSALLAERDRLLTTIQELDFDFALGKIPAEDYPPQRELLVQNGIDLLQKLDILNKDQVDAAVEERLEQAIAARRAVAPLAQAPSFDQAEAKVDINVSGASRRADATARLRIPSGSTDDLEALIATRRKARQEKTAGFCPQCGKPVMFSDRFCSNCGTLVASR
ncbi:MAG: zinc ribbon domain-containing protein [Anaerolineaceae bacterium]|nr:zinc ribbon domain-containing protein [Anaerolineaceae bacterium]